MEHHPLQLQRIVMYSTLYRHTEQSWNRQQLVQLERTVLEHVAAGTNIENSPGTCSSWYRHRKQSWNMQQLVQI